MTKKYLIKYKKYMATSQMDGVYVEKSTIIEIDPVNLSDKYINELLNLDTFGSYLSYYYDIIPLS